MPAMVVTPVPGNAKASISASLLFVFVASRMRYGAIAT